MGSRLLGKEIHAELTDFLITRDLATDVSFYNPKQWADRSETVGNRALLSLTFEGAFYRVMNYPTDPTERQWQEEVQDILLAYGCYYELGYSWSLHIYERTR